MYYRISELIYLRSPSTTTQKELVLKFSSLTITLNVTGKTIVPRFLVLNRRRKGSVSFCVV